MLKVSNLTKTFIQTSGVFRRDKQVVKAVDGVSFSIAQGETLGLVGESGCGKSTLGKTILRLIEPTDGSIEFKGSDITKVDEKTLRGLRRKMQLIFQDPYGSLNPRMTIGSIVGEPLQIHGMFRDKNARQERIAQLLSLVGMRTDVLERYPHEFSGGQRQRITIARALAVEPQFIVCDEPVSALDVSIRAQIINLLQDLQEQLSLTYLFVAHDLMVVKHISTRIAVMYLGNIVEIGASDAICDEPKHPYTQALLSAVPSVNKSARKERIVLSGEIPSPIHPPSGCKFHTRCPKVMQVCKSVVPEMIQVGDKQEVACHLYD